MSNIFGRIKKSSSSEKTPPVSNFGKTIVDTNQLTISLEGIPETSFYNVNQEGDSGFIVVGVGLKEENHLLKHLGYEDWAHICTKKIPGTVSLQGHFLIIRWDKEGVYIHNDVFGLRTLYLYEDDSKNIFFSTRMDWLTKVIPNPALDVENFSSYWILINQVDYGAFIKNVHRLGPNGQIQIRNGNISITEDPFVPSWNTYTEGDFYDYLRLLTNPNSMYETATGLSGGLDSRAILAASDEYNLRSYSFGDINNPDVAIAGKVANEAGSNHTFYESIPPDFKNSVDKITDYAVQLNGTSLSYNCFIGEVLNSLNKKNMLLLDGGSGEIHRRQFLGKLAFLNYKSAEDIQPKELYAALLDRKFNFFDQALQRELESKALDKVEEIWTQVISKSDGSLGNSLDLFSLWTRVTNISAMNHGWYDSHIPAYMPFVQKNLLEIGFGISEVKRRNGKLFRNIIKNRSRKLSRYPLVKDGITYPFAFGKYSSFVYSKFKRKLKPGYRDSFGENYLHRNKDFIMDLVASAKVQECSLYDYSKIRQTVHDFYNGRTHLQTSVNQWLTFELWRGKNL